MIFAWEESRTAFADAARWYVETTALVGNRWDQPGLGEWDIRGLVGHTSRSLLTVEAYLAVPPAAVEVATAADYVRSIRAAAAGPGALERGRAAAEALGPDPAPAVAEIARRVLALVDTCDGSELLTSLVGGMTLRDYLPTRTFELAVHTCDLTVALGLPAQVPPSAAVQALAVICDVVAHGGDAAALLLATTGRRPLPAGYSVL